MPSDPTAAPPTAAPRRRADIFLPDVRQAPLWLDDVGQIQGPTADPPARADVAVIGSGYTGLNAALQLAHGGRGVAVLEAGHPGEGCSTRNGGQISTSVKPSAETLAKAHGRERALAIRAEGVAALAWIKDFVAREAIDCDFVQAGRFRAAHTPKQYEAMAREAEKSAREEDSGDYAVARAEQHRELGTDAYHGGVVMPRHASLHPAKYHRGLLDHAIAAGAQVIPFCRALKIDGEAGAFRIETERGTVTARDVVVATNGYTSALTPWMRRRAIPIGSYIIATEPLPPALMDELFPTRRVFSDSRKVLYYYRTSPDRRRVVFGGRVSAAETDPMVSGPRLHRAMVDVFPELAAFRVSHTWAGIVAYSFDEIAHTGVHEGLHYAMTYCGSGVSMASYLGMRLGQKILGLPEGRTAFDDLPFPTRPLYQGRPWFLPAAVAWYRLRDRIDFASGS